MSKLEELIQNHCPNGVEKKSLLEVANVLYGFPCDASQFNESCNGMPLVRIRDVLNGTTNTSTTENIPERYYISNGDLLVGMDGNFHVSTWNGGTAILCQRVCKIYAAQNEKYIYNGFLKHLLKPIFKSIENGKQGGTVKHLSAKDISNIKIPVPPLEVQSEIVRILDNFTELTTELTTKLNAELSARKKQYEYYRDKLLTFGDDVPMVKLDDIATDIYRGSGIKREETTPDGIPCLRYGEIYTSYDISFTECISHTKEDVVKTPKYFEHGDIIFTITGESVEEIAKSIAYLGYDKCMAGGDTVVMKHNQEPRYISYALSTTAAQAQKSKGRVKSKVVHSSVPALKDIMIPLPDMKTQKRIADLLDNFHKLCTDLSSGIPAEINARQKQYEYYRDKLLTFKEKESSYGFV